MITQEYDVLVVGEINPDLILTDRDIEPRFDQQEVLVEDAALTIGSSNAIFACGAARLGLKVTIRGIIGNDMFGTFMLDSLTENNVDITHVIIDPAVNTGLSVILNRIKDRAILTFTGAINALKADQVPNELLSQARHLHVASYFLQTNLQLGLRNLFSRAQQLGLTTSLDTNWDPAEEWTGVHELLPFTDIFLPNQAEALALTGTHEPESAAKNLACISKLVAVKLGAAGALACKDQELIRRGAYPLTVVDTVGAGDSFDAGFIYGYLMNWPLEKILNLGVACGSISTRKPGGTNGQPSISEALELMEQEMEK